jgi:eukaryotic-like serine/threonine-protein kinase
MTQDDPVREIARVIRGALRLEIEIVLLVEPPQGPGQHLLEIDIPGGETITLLAEPAGPPRPDGYPLRVRPTTRVQMADLFALVERLDEPSRTVPPPAEDEQPPSSGLGLENTIVQSPRGMIAGFGVIESLVPGPPSSDEPPSEPSSVRSAPPSAAPRSLADPQIGRILAGKYRIQSALGSGMAATVYRATHIDLRRDVAVKILHAQNRGEAQFVKRFKSEALTASKLEHPNVTRIIDFGQEPDGELYLVMELVVGTQLETVVASGPMRARRVVDIGIQVCRALQFAHEKSVIHRDIKPENIMLVADRDDDGAPCDLVKVCDFGLAKLREPGEEDLTVAGMLCGSPAYMSPEQTRGEPLDARADLYALGVTMFEALTGALPHEAFSIAELFIKKSTLAPRRVSSLVPNIDPLLEDVIMRAMATDPTGRHLSARELRAELRAVRDQMKVDEEDEAEDHRTILGG